MCLRPLSIRNPKYRDSDMTAYPTFPEDYNLLVPCGSCVDCRKNCRADWMVRLLVELQSHIRKGNVVWFVTFTLAPERYEEFKADPHRPVRLFLENYRRKVGKSCTHFIISELGDSTHRLHYHGFLFNPSLTEEELKRLWIYGFSCFEPANFDSVPYVTKYILKPQNEEEWYKPKKFVSPGLGRSYLDRFEGKLLDGSPNRLIKINGYNYRMPRYIRQKLYSEGYLRSLKYDRKRADFTPSDFKESLRYNGVKFDTVDSLLTYKKSRLDESLKRKASLPLKPKKNYLKGIAPDVDAFDDFAPF